MTVPKNICAQTTPKRREWGGGAARELQKPYIFEHPCPKSWILIQLKSKLTNIGIVFNITHNIFTASGYRRGYIT